MHRKRIFINHHAKHRSPHRLYPHPQSPRQHADPNTNSQGWPIENRHGSLYLNEGRHSVKKRDVLPMTCDVSGNFLLWPTASNRKLLQEILSFFTISPHETVIKAEALTRRYSSSGHVVGSTVIRRAVSSTFKIENRDEGASMRVY